ncbi:hypothetical protein [Moritella sp. Urea-trap-13]|uniref:hypothetical protein n=1 Tax=Moritella sp. Urea-trap-13 TaxID=2058327 RepID=UPI000C346B51|nr:hypothetical protein [Moritella sp. Urea-trap-13]PKH08175.1 hypothetical protein CXF93_05730 [Moritella sp. Urea-trap-13]
MNTDLNMNNTDLENLMASVNYLHMKVEELSKNYGHTGWMSIKHAAGLVGLSRNALIQRISNEHYPEGIVWRQKDKGCAIMINLKELNKIL